jgi:hypothetical protein
MGAHVKKASMIRRGMTAVVGLAVVAGALVGVASPASAIETITTTPSVIDPAATMTVTINGFPTMASGNGYIYWLDFSNLTGSGSNTGTSSGTYGSQTDCTTATGVTFATVSGPGTALPNGQDIVGSTAACQWMSTTKFRFSYKGATGLTSSSVISLTFPASRFTLPGSGEYGLNFTAGATQQYALSSVCWGNCPTGVTAGSVPQITIDIDPNGGTCVTSKVTGVQNSWGKAPGVDDCTRPGFFFTGYNTSPDGKGIWISKLGDIHFTGDNRIYAQWFDPTAPVVASEPPVNVVATGKWNRVQVNWDAPTKTGTYPITNYLVSASPSGKVCITRLSDKKFTQCSFNELTPGTQYSFNVQALTGAGWSERSVVSNVASPFNLRVTKFDRSKVLFGLAGTKVKLDLVTPGYAPGVKITPMVSYDKGAKWSKMSGDSFNTAAAIARFPSLKFGRNYNKTTISVKFVDPEGNESNSVNIPPAK